MRAKDAAMSAKDATVSAKVATNVRQGHDYERQGRDDDATMKAKNGKWVMDELGDFLTFKNIQRYAQKGYTEGS